MSGLPDVALGAGAVLGSGGIFGFVKWLIARRESNVARLEKRVAALEEELRDVWLAFAHVTAALRHKDPTDPALALAGKILKDKFPVDPNTPADMQEQLRRMK
jgi:hypothetical protein